MAGKYRAVDWNHQKRLYDTTIFSGVLLILAAYAITSFSLIPGFTPEMLMVRGTALSAILLLHVILVIGPLARLSPVFLPLLYNRRHLGTAMFLFALVHALLSTLMFHAMGPVNPLVSIFTAYQSEYSLAPGRGAFGQFPFEPFGFLALVILFLMAVTSHDFWLKNLGAGVWKTLHILVYVAYGSVLVHVAYGALQFETSPVYVALLGVGFVIVIGLHLAAGAKEVGYDKAKKTLEADGFASACRADEVAEGCGKAVAIAGERRAIFRHLDRMYALSNICRHQGGPVGEGKIIDGCVTCPWHGWQYKPEDGVSPPPFHEVIETYPVRVVDGVVYVNPTPLNLERKSDGAPIQAEA